MKSKLIFISFINILLLFGACDDNNRLIEENQKQVNLTTFKVETSDYSWDDIIIVKNNAIEDGYRNMHDDIIEADGNLYINCSFINNGDLTLSAGLYNQIWIDGELVKEIEFNNVMEPEYYWMHWNHLVPALSAGTHTIKFIIDANNNIAESNENDNEYSRTFTVR